MNERLQKLLAAAGVASRRAAEALILAGRVTVNGRTVRELGTRADPERDDVRVDGRPVHAPAALTYLLLHKPRGYTSTVSDPHAAQTVVDLLPPAAGRVFPVGRLDRDSEGLLLLTNDGELTARLLHPRYHVPKEYAVLVQGRLSDAALRRLREGVPLDGTRTAPAEVEPAGAPRQVRGTPQPGGVWLRVVLHEGRRRQIREMCAHVGLEVVRLIRTGMGPLTLGDLRPGGVRRLSATEARRLRRAGGLDPLPPHSAASGPHDRHGSHPGTAPAPRPQGGRERAAGARSVPARPPGHRTAGTERRPPHRSRHRRR